MSDRSVYIAIEGLEGAGKSTLIDKLAKVLRDRGNEVLIVREPGGTPMAEEIRTVVKKMRDEPVDPITELLLMMAARRQLLMTVVKPALDAGKIVIGDRSYLSTMAYQGAGRDLLHECSYLLPMVVSTGLRPDLALYLDIPPQVGLERARGRAALDRIESLPLEFFNKARTWFLQNCGSKYMMRKVDANVSEAVLFNSAWAIVNDFLK